MKRRPLVLVGAGGFARETVEVVAAINAVEPTWDLLGFVDDSPSLQGARLCGLPILGPCGWVVDEDVAVVVCVGTPVNFTSRARLVTRLRLEPERYATLVHPTAVIPPSVDVGRGTVIHALSVATGWATIGNHVAVMPAAVFTHDDRIADFATVAAGVRLAGGVTVETGAYLGSGAMIREYRTIGAWSLVGMGSVVTGSVPPGEVWAGVPAVFMRPSGQDTAFLTQGVTL